MAIGDIVLIVLSVLVVISGCIFRFRRKKKLKDYSITPCGECPGCKTSPLNCDRIKAASKIR